MKLKLNEHELDYLTRIVEEHCGEFFENDTEEYKEMIRDLYSKLIVLTKTKTERYCPKCSKELEIEKEKEIDYPYVCLECDENFYEFETIKTK